ncbi:Regulator_of chromosome condensation (RCC1) repeat-containing protein [Hexamita inflata]|uniref:Regulator of chromosome condensation (RCC1) repeat-containing protein n=1 Tax=Hexamita inflata TaxID=28002 RepID=A0AA86U0U6_9EUKA|nr:Regulator of chromosome condensation (RCC1) repeat-containing protein [Hexamita inflata]
MLIILQSCIQATISVTGNNDQQTFNTKKLYFDLYTQLQLPLEVTKVELLHKQIMIFENDTAFTTSLVRDCEISTGPFNTLQNVSLNTIFQNMSVKQYAKYGDYMIVLLQNNTIFYFDLLKSTFKNIMCVNQLDTSIIPKTEVYLGVGIIFNVSYVITDKNIYYIGDCDAGYCGLTSLAANSPIITGYQSSLTKLFIPPAITQIKTFQFFDYNLAIFAQDDSVYVLGNDSNVTCEFNNDINRGNVMVQLLAQPTKRVSFSASGLLLLTNAGDLYFCGHDLRALQSKTDAGPVYAIVKTLTKLPHVADVVDMCTQKWGWLLLKSNTVYFKGQGFNGSTGSSDDSFYSDTDFQKTKASLDGYNRIICNNDQSVLFEEKVLVNSKAGMNFLFSMLAILGVDLVGILINSIFCSRKRKQLRKGMAPLIRRD